MLVEEYIKELKQVGRSPKTVVNIYNHLKRYRRYMGDNFYKRVEEAQSKEIEEYIKHIREKVGESTVVQKYFIINRFYRYLSKNGYILDNPMNELKIRFNRNKLLARIAPSEEVIKTVLDSTNEYVRRGIRNRAVLELLYSSGLRQKELIELKLSDIDLARGIVCVRQSKTHRSRVVPVGRIAIKWIARYIKEDRTRFTVKRANEEYLFLTERGKGLNRHIVEMIIRGARNRSKVEEKITTHSFRYACAMHMLRGGAGIREVAEILGHSRLSTTQLYTKMNKNMVKSVHKKSHPREKFFNKKVIKKV